MSQKVFDEVESALDKLLADAYAIDEYVRKAKENGSVGSRAGWTLLDALKDVREYIYHAQRALDDAEKAETSTK